MTQNALTQNALTQNATTQKTTGNGNARTTSWDNA